MLGVADATGLEDMDFGGGAGRSFMGHVPHTNRLTLQVVDIDGNPALRHMMVLKDLARLAKSPVLPTLVPNSRLLNSLG